MREQVDRLTKLTTDLLDLSKLDADAIEIRLRGASTSDAARGADRRRVRARRARSHGVRGSRWPRDGGDGAALALRRPGSGRADPPYPARQRPHPHAGGNSDHSRPRGPQTGRRELTVSDDGPGIDPRSRGARVRALLHRRLGQRVRASGSRSRASWRCGWTASSRVARARGRTDFVLELPAPADDRRPATAGAASNVASHDPSGRGGTRRGGRRGRARGRRAGGVRRRRRRRRDDDHDDDRRRRPRGGRRRGLERGLRPAGRSTTKAAPGVVTIRSVFGGELGGGHPRAAAGRRAGVGVRVSATTARSSPTLTS